MRGEQERGGGAIFCKHFSENRAKIVRSCFPPRMSTFFDMFLYAKEAFLTPQKAFDPFEVIFKKSENVQFCPSNDVAKSTRGNFFTVH